ncbi:MAG: ribonuclease III [Lachnospiraceae bacterium]|jgi:ribonuclease-3 family protein|nr:ribonuclease III [Lachnospiraceae bacterium]
METGLIRKALLLKEIDVGSYSPLALAYIGDAVYEVLIRTKVMNQGNMQVNKMHKKSSSLVKAEAQANMIRLLMEELSEEETIIYKRGRNAKSATIARHASMMDYRMATGLEALVGYLYLAGRDERLLELIHDGLEKMGELS